MSASPTASRMIRTIRACSVVSLVAMLLTTIALPINAQSRCAELLARLGSSSEDLRIADRDFNVSALDVGRLDAVRQQMAELAEDVKVVVYFPVVTSDGIANVRMENVGKGDVRVEIAGVTKMTSSEFSGLLEMARQPNANYVRSVLQRDLMPADSERDRGKLVFFRDLSFHGLLPQLFNRGDGYVLASPSLSQSVKNVRVALQAKAEPKTFTAFVGFPETPDDFTFVFASQPGTELQKWKDASDRFLNMSQTLGLDAYTAATIGALETKDNVLKKLEDCHGIVFLVAHASGCRVFLPGSVSFTITPYDIAQLKLKHSPFVILRICNGEDTGFAPSFLRAGASSVWMNTGKIDAESATEQIQTFLEFLRDGETVGGAIRQTQEKYPSVKAAVGLFAQRSPQGVVDKPDIYIPRWAIRYEHNN